MPRNPQAPAGAVESRYFPPGLVRDVSEYKYDRVDVMYGVGESNRKTIVKHPLTLHLPINNQLMDKLMNEKIN